MKIKYGVSYKELLEKPEKKQKKPSRPSFFFRTLIRTLSIPDLVATKFKYTSVGMEKLSKKEPCFILMNHSSFIDLKIASRILYPRKYNIVCTSDGFIGKNWLMRQIGCIPTKKFVSEVSLLHDMLYAVKRYNSSILMYPEASYSFDGTATPLPESLGRCVKMFGLPVVTIRTDGAFLRDPLYNNLQLRKTQVTAQVEYLLSPEQIKEMTPCQINELLREKFLFDNFRSQQQKGVKIDEDFRADHLNRVLYKCPHCLAEGQTEGKGTTLTCHACGKQYELTEDGFMRAIEGETEFDHIPDWYAWERENVRRELEDGTYSLDVAVDIYAMVDTDCIYSVGEGRLTHNREGFHLVGCDGELDYVQSPLSSYSLYADYYWYKLGDIICIGDKKMLYYCFPKDCGDVVAKTRLAAEELYKIVRAEKRSVRKETV
ncbi:MAG: 1-acyl-sn-glycerol-3-phosphate acyltransferase [Clostridia bacterium]|nr:1-acyl-sn-glycerol-3-phosphate acyltransferase [Clostridia bacterium]